MSKLYYALPLALSLSACGGNSASVANVDRIVVGDAVSDAALNSRIRSLSASYVDDFDNDKFASSVPTSGRATMSGAVLIGDPILASSRNLNKADVLGQIDISVDFASNDVDGIASDFRVKNGDDFDGELILDARILRNSDAGIAGTLKGTLENDDAGPSDLAFDVKGNFMGAGAAGLVAGGTGTVKYDGNDVDTVGVVFAAD